MKSVKDVERELENLIKKYRLEKKLTVGKVKKMVRNESGASAIEEVHKFQKKCFSYFPEPEKIDDLQKIAQVFTDAWNYFPHKSLKGKSPFDMSEDLMKDLEKSGGQEGEVDKKTPMPKIIVGGHEMEWSEYVAMLEEMEKQQEPFKKWIETEAMPRYEKYLHSTLTEKTAEKHYEVADIFFERVLHVGFIEFDQIRKAFIQKEFPRWWQTHVLMSNLKEKEIVSSLQKLFEFIEFTFNTDIKKFGF